MSDFRDFDVEISDNKESNPEQFNGVVTSAGTPVVVSPTGGNNIQLAFVKSSNKGVNANGPTDVLYLTIDGSANVISISRGEYIYIPGVFTSIKIDSNNNGVKYELILWS